jgi:exodeoxyribonuclease VII large subunit
MNRGSEPDVHTVSRLTGLLRDHLEGTLPTFVVVGELSNFRSPGSGHWYFRLKDEWAALDAAMFARANRRVGFRPRDGDEVIATGRVEIFAQRGALQLVVERLEAVGAGRLQARLEELKAKLVREGLFDAARKRPLPRVPRRVGIVTSRNAAALHDMLRVLARRDPSLAITIAPCRVQGRDAGPTIVGALHALQRTDVEVILLGRGGGSLEDLWAFNEEPVVRAVAASRVPIVCGVGHEIDVTLSDFAADARAATPTAAAELAVPIRADLEVAIRDLSGRLLGAKMRGDRVRRDRVADLRGRLVGPGRRLDEQAQRLDETRRRLESAAQRGVRAASERHRSVTHRLARVSPASRLPAARERTRDLRDRLTGVARRDLRGHRERAEVARRSLLTLGPLQSVQRGYAIATQEGSGSLLRRAGEVEVGESVRVRLAEGALVCSVETVVPEPVDLRGRSK